MITWDEQTDVVVIGSGVAGCSAAIEARSAGASVIVLEKMKITGGNTRISDGGLAAPGNRLQKEQGIEDSPELFYQDILKAGLNLNHPALVKTFAEQGAGAVEWLQMKLGVQFMDRLDRFGGHSVARCLTTSSHSGKDIVKAQTSRLKQMEVEIRTQCLLTNLLTDDSGKVCGVRIKTGYNHNDLGFKGQKNIRARRAVILATGGFGNDVAFRMLQNPNLDTTVTSTNHRGATAEGLSSALKIGAVPVHLSWIQTGPWGCVDEVGYGSGSRFASYALYPNGILVDPSTGRRIVSEWAGRQQRSMAIFKAGHPCVGIMDAQGVEHDPQSLKKCLKTGKVYEFSNLIDLAKAYKIPSDTLTSTVKEYNKMIRKGQTDQFAKPLETAQRISSPPFFAMHLWPKVHYTPGGVGINTDAQVIDVGNQPIPNLYAAGEVCGGIHGADRLGSCALTECLVFGRIAGRNAAAERG
ncbi:flavocytochrome c [Desulfobacter hydrogenophilus]|uniref:Flavocytochrome c n=1 Tax=Desulfobacter hydrogenophilus TaxID=2291 RepID=A0A328FGZ4_9BACT|nr:flavocytochrome c [Desulfobacter hydrogenophilus]NDY71386.1 flavocytochrome c [Desulfobacter hydrogenophilus]QBH12219.1 flavocytochrome c [Desulfobacter hydrogenophilus]RAM03456.1 flavocytochrome c [Desulfobacter hydrogenophilus]